mgnify:CR=1 FL=1
MNESEIFKKLKEFEIEIQQHIAKSEILIDKRIKWCKENRESIKALYPKKGKIYQIKNPLSVFKSEEMMFSYGNHRMCIDRFSIREDRWINNCPDDHFNDIYFFKPTNIMFSPHIDFEGGWNGGDKPTVKGSVLDNNLNVIKRYDEQKIYITDIIEVEEEKLTEELKLEISGDCTNVYVMIDKNTGYYKIGRSIKPEYREKTLQSEKPTIEMLFSYKAKAKDETYLHKHFKTQRIRGEWFDLKGSDLTTIRRYLNTGSV